MKRQNKIQVSVRIKPNISNQHESIEDWITNKVQRFATNVWSTQDSQSKVYSDFMQNQFVPAFSSGLNFTCFLFGQTGSGKTYTMFGPPDHFQTLPTSFGMNCNEHPAYWGIFPRCISFILNSNASSHLESRVFVSMVELYQDRCYDLLNNHARVQLSKSDRRTSVKSSVSLINAQYDKDGKWIPPFLDGKENTLTVELQGQKEIEIKNHDQLIDVCQLLESARHTNEHALNKRSSRSHCIVTVRLIDRQKEYVLKFIDLAGSEKIKQTQASGQVLNEAKSINTSLSTLGRVLVQLNDGMKFISYRDSPLTVFLQDSLTGDNVTSIIVTVESSSIMKLETRSSLNFAERCSKVDSHRYSKNNVQVVLSKHPSNACLEPEEYSIESELNALYHQLKEVEEELDLLRQRNQHGRNNPDFPKSTINSFSTNKQKLLHHMHELQICKQQLVEMNAKKQHCNDTDKDSFGKDYDFLQTKIEKESLNVKNFRGLVLRQLTTGIWIPPKQSYSRKLLRKGEIQKRIQRLGGTLSNTKGKFDMDDDDAFARIEDLLIDFDG